MAPADKRTFRTSEMGGVRTWFSADAAQAVTKFMGPESPFADIDAVVTEDRVGHRDVEEDVWDRDLQQVVLAADDLTGGPRKVDFSLVCAGVLLFLDAFHERDGLADAGAQLVERLLVVVMSRHLLARQPGRRTFDVVARALNLVGERLHVGARAGCFPIALQHQILLAAACCSALSSTSPGSSGSACIFETACSTRGPSIALAGAAGRFRRASSAVNVVRPRMSAMGRSLPPGGGPKPSIRDGRAGRPQRGPTEFRLRVDCCRSDASQQRQEPPAHSRSDGASNGFESANFRSAFGYHPCGANSSPCR